LFDGRLIETGDTGAGLDSHPDDIRPGFDYQVQYRHIKVIALKVARQPKALVRCPRVRSARENAVQFLSIVILLAMLFSLPQKTRQNERWTAGLH